MSIPPSFDELDRALVAEAAGLKQAMAEIVRKNPQRGKRIHDGLERALEGHPNLLGLAVLADVISGCISEMNPRLRAPVLLALTDVAMEMAAIRDEGVH